MFVLDGDRSRNLLRSRREDRPLRQIKIIKLILRQRLHYSVALCQLRRRTTSQRTPMQWIIEQCPSAQLCCVDLCSSAAAQLCSASLSRPLRLLSVDLLKRRTWRRNGVMEHVIEILIYGNRRIVAAATTQRSNGVSL
jgi:hypothetical protein